MQTEDRPVLLFENTVSQNELTFCWQAVLAACQQTQNDPSRIMTLEDVAAQAAEYAVFYLGEESEMFNAKVAKRIIQKNFAGFFA